MLFRSTPSPVASINVAAHETVTISLPYREGLQKRVYVREGERWRRNTIPAETTVADLYTGALVLDLPTTNSFPNADPAIFRSTNGNVVVRGDGSGKWGPLTFAADGSMTGPMKMATGSLDQPNVASGGGMVENTVALPPGKFSTPPTVIVQATNGRVNAIADLITETSFRVRSWNFASPAGNAGTNVVSWIAFGGSDG